MRRQYLDLFVGRLARGDVRLALRALATLGAAWAGAARPLLGTLVVTYRCDLRCAMCDLPQRGDRARELGTAGLKGVLDGMVDLGVLGVGITGGEPLLRPDLAQLVHHGTRRGLLMHVNTNGSLVTDEAARAFARAGLASVNVSLDGPDAELHDRLRRRDGSYARVLRAVARLCAVRRRPYRVALTCAVGAGNAARAGELVDRARDLGVDRIGFLPVHEFPANRVAAAPDAGWEELLARWADDPLVDNSRDYLALFAGAFAGRKNPVACAAPRVSLVADCYGDVYPCVPLHAARRRVAHGDVRRVWRSRTYRRARAALRGCRACYWNCHTELNLALARLGARG